MYLCFCADVSAGGGGGGGGVGDGVHFFRTKQTLHENLLSTGKHFKNKFARVLLCFS